MGFNKCELDAANITTYCIHTKLILLTAARPEAGVSLVYPEYLEVRSSAGKRTPASRGRVYSYVDVM